MGQAHARAAGGDASANANAAGTFREVLLRDVQRIDAAADEGWLARDRAGRLWHVAEDGRTRQIGEGIDPSGLLAVGHGRIAGRGLDGRLWVHQTPQPGKPGAAPQRSSERLAPHSGLCILPLAVIAVVEHAGSHVLARFEVDALGQWQVVARSRAAVLPDAVPIVADLDGRGDGGHIAVLAGPDARRYRHAVLGDDIEAIELIWLERHSLEPLRSLRLDAPHVFEDRVLRPWRLPGGRMGLVTVRSGALGAQLVVVAASPRDASRLEMAAAGPPIGTRHRWLSPASVEPDAGVIWAVHTPHIGGVLHRYHAERAVLIAERVASALSNHRLGDRELDISARVGRWLVLPAQDGRSTQRVDVTSLAVVQDE